MSSVRFDSTMSTYFSALVQFHVLTGIPVDDLLQTAPLEVHVVDGKRRVQVTREAFEVIERILAEPETQAIIQRRLGEIAELAEGVDVEPADAAQEPQEAVFEAPADPTPERDDDAPSEPSQEV